MTKVMLVFGGGDEGGGPAYLKSLLKNLDKSRFEVVYVSLGRDHLAEELRDDVKATDILEGWKAYLFTSGVGVRQALNKYHPDVVFTHGLRANLAGRAAGWSRKVPVVTTVHSAIARDYANAFKQHIAPKIDDLSLPLTDRFIAVSNAIRNDLIRRGVAPGKISIVYNGVDIPDERPLLSEVRAQLGLSTEHFVVGTVARLEPNKGIKFLVCAAKELREQLSDLRVVIVGAGRDKLDLEREAERLGISDIVTFTGFREDARRLMTSFDIFALPSLMEGFALVVIEAMAAGIPVVASQVGGVPEIIDNGRNGLLVDASDPRSLSQAILKLYHFPELRRSIMREAYEDFYGRFTTERFVAETANVLEEVGAGSRKTH
ncbi:MAG: glycosyltransferase [Chloroflexi bacterium]|nr:glycosyltransferase [Chloroflexota bacterium]